VADVGAGLTVRRGTTPTAGAGKGVVAGIGAMVRRELMDRRRSTLRKAMAPKTRFRQAFLKVR